MRRLGKGYRGTKRLLNLLNHPPTTKNYYTKISDNFHKAVKNVADHNMHLATEELRKLKPTLCNDDVKVNDITDVGLSVDGTWQKRGFTSLNCCWDFYRHRTHHRCSADEPLLPGLCHCSQFQRH